MKKFLFALALGLILVLALATAVSADNGPHGRFNGSTQACASCHRAHSALSGSDMLLVYSDIYELCTSCHDGTGAYTNVVDGYYDNGLALAHDVGLTGQRVLPDDPGKSVWNPATINNGSNFGVWSGQPGAGLFGGGFVYARMMTDYGNTATQTATTNTGTAYWTGLATDNINTSATAWAVKNAYDTNSLMPTGRPVTSAHKVGQTGAVSGTMWGSGPMQTGFLSTTSVGYSIGKTSTLECTSCHTPHGAGGKQNGVSTGFQVASYRLLQFSPAGEQFEGKQVVTTVGAGSGYLYAKLYWDQPSVKGVTVPDVTTYWYTPNTDITNDPTLAAYRGTASGVAVNDPVHGLQPSSAAEAYQAVFAGRGDYMGRYFIYKRPASAAAAAAVTLGSRPVSCPGGAGVVGTDAPTGTVSPATNTTACVAAAGTAIKPDYNNLGAQDVLGFWCATCHDRYLAPGGGSNGFSTNPDVNVHLDEGQENGGSRTTDTTDPGYHFRHRSQGVAGRVSTAAVVPATYSAVAAEGAAALPANVSWNKGSYGTGQYTCVTCHNAHGTVSQATALSQSATYAGTSALLKADNRAVCIRCHGTTEVNFFNQTTTPNAIWLVP
jgi:predicted CXXCH cytochrome family protein